MRRKVKRFIITVHYFFDFWFWTWHNTLRSHFAPTRGWLKTSRCLRQRRQERHNRNEKELTAALEREATATLEEIKKLSEKRKRNQLAHSEHCRPDQPIFTSKRTYYWLRRHGPAESTVWTYEGVAAVPLPPWPQRQESLNSSGALKKPRVFIFWKSFSKLVNWHTRSTADQFSRPNAFSIDYVTMAGRPTVTSDPMKEWLRSRFLVDLHVTRTHRDFRVHRWSCQGSHKEWTAPT